MGRIAAFMRLCRFHFLIPGLMLYVLGFLLAMVNGAEWNSERSILGYLVFFCAHFSLTFSNDYFDQVADSKNTPTALSGGSGALLSHPDMARLALALSLILIAASLFFGLIFKILFSPPWYFMVMVVLGNLAGFFYSAPPLRLAYRGAGELATVLAAGFLMPGMGYLCALGRLDNNFLILTPAFMAYGAFFIISVEVPDIEADRLGGKRNLLVRTGLRFGLRIALAAAVIASAYLFLFARILYEALYLYWLFLFSLIPLAVGFLGVQAWRGKRSRTIAQVKANFASLMAFLLLANAYLAWTLWA